MGNNNTATITPAVEAVATGELVHANPADVVIDVNVRTDATLDTAFAASIAARGVLLPVLATRDADGTLRVRDGQLRTLAAREAALASMPVYVISSAAADDAATIERITDQLQTNEQRTQLNNTDRATAFQQLLDLGVSRTKIAKVTHTPKKTVDAALAIAGSAHAMAAVNDLLTLEQGAIIAGYEADGDTEAVSELLEAAAQGRFEHKHAELVETADERAALREGLAHWRDKGFHVSDVRPQHRSAWIEFYGLVNAETGEKVTGEQLDDLTPSMCWRSWRPTTKRSTSPPPGSGSMRRRSIGVCRTKAPTRSLLTEWLIAAWSPRSSNGPRASPGTTTTRPATAWKRTVSTANAAGQR